MTRTSPPGPERRAFAGLAALMVAPVLAQGLWRPLEHWLGAAGTARELTGAALVICAFNAVVQGLVRPVVGRALLAGLATVALTASLSLGAAGFGALLPVAVVSAFLVDALPPRLPSELDGIVRRNRLLSVLYGLFALLSVAWISRVSVFIGDPTVVEYQALPGEEFTETHSCLTAYVRASELARQGVENLYEDPWWYGSRGLPPLPEGEADPWEPFELDNFSYPPPFLLLTTPLAPLDGDFLAQRALWFGLNGILAALGMWVVARWLDGRAAHRALLLAPLFLGSVPVLLTLQIGNFHLLAVVLSVLAMVALERAQTTRGAALLALTTLSKISPGVLGIGLLVRRRAREVAYTAGFGALLLGLAALVFGPEPLVSFVRYALPRLSSGAAFPFMDTDAGLATNMGPFGIPFKLKFLGFNVGDPWRIAPWVSRVYTIGLVTLAVASARRQADRRDRAIRWMALLALAAMQSPFSPAYSLLGLLWATTLVAVEVRRAREAVALAALWPALLFVPPGLSVAELSVLSIAQTTLALGVCAWLAVRAPRLPELP